MKITIQNISKSYGGRDIFSEFSLEVQSGTRLCVCGPNGCGKSTLLRIIAGVDSCDGGRIILPKGCRLGYVEQEFDDSALDTPLLDWVQAVLPDWGTFWQEWDDAMLREDKTVLARLGARHAELETSYGYNPEHRAQTVLSGLGFSQKKWTKTIRALSGGWRERAKLARVLTAGADALLLDEPTNHLDLDAVEWLEKFLLDFKGALVFVAHDRIFMDRVGTHILALGGAKPLFRKTTFSQFIELQEEQEEQRERMATRLTDELQRKQAFVDRFRAKATKARQAASHQKMANRIEKELEHYQPEAKRRELHFSWPEPAKADKMVLGAHELEFHFPDGSSLWSPLSFNLYCGQKIALVGPNGCGKSTLLKILTGKSAQNSGTLTTGNLVRMGYFSQHRTETLNGQNSVLSEIRRLSDPRMTEEELMSVLGLFMLGQSFFDREVNTLSGGEKSRLVLSALFLARNNFLILDEPTNHLDLESRQALIDALEEYSGTLLMVAHDRYLLSAVADQIWALGENGLTVYQHGFEEYNAARLEQKNTIGRGLLSNQNSTADQNPESIKSVLSRDDAKKIKREKAEQRNALYKKIKPCQDDYAALEKKLSAQMDEQGEIEQTLASPEVYADGPRASDLLRRFGELKNSIEKSMEKLEKLEADIAALEAERDRLSE